MVLIKVLYYRFMSGIHALKPYNPHNGKEDKCKKYYQLYEKEKNHYNN